MRYINFRAWDVRGNLMIPDAINATETQQLLTTTLDLQDPFAYFDGLKWMQCVEVKDKNDKMMYEGDLVLMPSLHSHEHDNEIVEIKYLNGTPCYVNIYTKKVESIFSYIGDYDKDEEAEIIGNIYENSEILNNGSGSKSGLV